MSGAEHLDIRETEWPEQPRRGRIHDEIVTTGGAQAIELAHDWYQHVAAMEPCPVCEIIERELKAAEQRERDRVRRLLSAGHQAHGVHVLPHSVIAAVLGGFESVEAMRENERGGHE